MKLRDFAIFAGLAALFAACSPPKYVTYKSVSHDFTVGAPWGWDVVADADRDAFSQVMFIGPFDKDFYRGVPTLSVRWYKPYSPHSLRDGLSEMYSSSDDFIKQTLNDVYGKDAIVYGKSEGPIDARTPIARNEIPEIVLNESRLPAKYFAVFSPVPAPAGDTLGTVVDEHGVRLNQRYHEYAVVPIMDGGREMGFYVLCYPATLGGHDKGMDRFKNLMGTFRPLTVGPGGPKFRAPSRS